MLTAVSDASKATCQIGMEITGDWVRTEAAHSSALPLVVECLAYTKA